MRANEIVIQALKVYKTIEIQNFIL